MLGRLERERGVKGRRLRSNSKERGAMRTITVLEGTSPEREREREKQGRGGCRRVDIWSH